MGVDTKIYLPANVRLGNLTDVVCRLLGAPVEKRPLGDSHPGAWSASTPKGVVHYRNVVPEMVSVTIKRIDYKIYGQRSINFGYHFEFGGYRRGKNMGGGRGIMLRSYAVNIALFKRLADFFGGTVDYCDCDSKEDDYVVPHKDDNMNCPEDGKPWQNLQERIMGVQPLTQGEIDALERVASYHEDATQRADRLAGGKKGKTIRAVAEAVADKIQAESLGFTGRFEDIEMVLATARGLKLIGVRRDGDDA